MKHPKPNAIDRRAFLKAAMAAGAIGAGWPISQAWGQSTTLRQAAASRKMLAGSAISNTQLHNPAIASIIAEQCSIVVAENEMKWDAIHPALDRYDFRAADELADFAAKNGLRLRGHNLCWHDAQPRWLASVATPSNAAQLLEDHIATVAGRYAGRIHSWDVVNEAISLDDGRPDGLRKSLWFNLLGRDYIEIAFRAAAKADPKALLTYNDYGLESQGNDHEDRRDVTFELLRWMRKSHIPVHAVGLQSHLSAHYDELPDWSGLHHFIKQVTKLELKVFVTELDIDDNNMIGTAAEREKEGAWLCANYLEDLLKHAEVEALLTWGMVSHGVYGARDDAGHRELPFDENLQSSPILSAMLGALQKR